MAKMVSFVRQVHQNASLTGSLALLSMEEPKNGQGGGCFPLLWEHRAPAAAAASAGRGCHPGSARAARATGGQRPPPARESRPARLSAAAARAPLGHHRAGQAGPRAGRLRQPLPEGWSAAGGAGSSSEPRPHQARCAACRVDFSPPENLEQFSSGRNKACCQIVLNGVSSQSHSPLHMAWV